MKNKERPANSQRPYKEDAKWEERRIPGQFGQLCKDRLHVENLSGNEETDSDRGKVDDPRCHLKNSSDISKSEIISFIFRCIWIFAFIPILCKINIC